MAICYIIMLIVATKTQLYMYAHQDVNSHFIEIVKNNWD